MNITTTKPWDGRLAKALVGPLVSTLVTPNHLTTVRLLVGLVAAAVLAHGGSAWLITGASLFVLGNFLDHTDGELARRRGVSSRWGAAYDQISDGLTQVIGFAAMGVGLRESWLGQWAILIGAVAALAVAVVFVLNARGEREIGVFASDQPTFAGFEIEDVLYTLPLVTALDGLPVFLIGASAGAPVYLIWTLANHRSLLAAKRAEDESSPQTSAIGG